MYHNITSIIFLSLCYQIVSSLSRTRTYTSKRYIDATDPFATNAELDIWCRVSANDNPKRPIIMYVHGGGWESGDKYDPPMPPLGYNIPPHEASYDTFTIVSVNYRLAAIGSPGLSYQIEQIVKARDWIVANKNTYGTCLDSDEIACVGESAGAHLCSLLGTRYGAAKIDKVVSFWGVHDFTDASLNLCHNRMLICDSSTPLGQYGEDKYVFGDGKAVSTYQNTQGNEMLNLMSASPCAWVAFANIVPAKFFILHGDNDMIVNWKHSEKLKNDLVAKGHNPWYYIAPGKNHEDLGQDVTNWVVLFLLYA